MPWYLREKPWLGPKHDVILSEAREPKRRGRREGGLVNHFRLIRAVYPEQREGLTMTIDFPIPSYRGHHAWTARSAQYQGQGRASSGNSEASGQHIDHQH